MTIDPFQYTNRQNDLAADTWQPHDPWEQHYPQTGYEDRDAELETYLNQRVGALLAQHGSSLGRRNLLDNGQFNINQRALATTGALGAIAAYLADRWSAANSNVGVAVMNWQTFAAAFGSTTWVGPNPRPANVQWIQQTTIDAALAAADNLSWMQGIEGLNLQHLRYGTADAEPLVLSFNCYSTVATTYTVAFRQITNNRYLSRSFPVVAGWNYVTLTIPGDTTTALANTTAEAFRVQFYLAAGTNFTSAALQSSWGPIGAFTGVATGVTNAFSATLNNRFAVANVQLEIGTTPTSYEIRPFAQELSECERYFERVDCPAAAGIRFASGFCFTVTNAATLLVYKIAKRDVPAVSVSVVGNFGVFNAAGAIIACTALTGVAIGVFSCQMSATVAAGLVAGDGTMLVAGANACFIDISADI